MSGSQAITTRQQTAITALISGQTFTAAATAAHVSTQTLWRWQREPVFVDELAKQKAAVVDQASRELAAHASTAIRTLAELAEGAESDADRIRASGLILRHMFGRADVDEIEHRYAMAHARILRAMAGSTKGA